jgi:hypothetical protein
LGTLNTPNGRFYFGTDDGYDSLWDLGVFYGTSGTSYLHLVTDPLFAPGVLHMMTAVIGENPSDNTLTCSVYLDGALKEQENYNVTMSNYVNPDYPLYLGAANNMGNPDYYFAGSLDDVTIFDKALSPEEVSALYAKANHIIAWYKMDDADNTVVVRDSSGNGYHGTSVNKNTSLMHTADGKIGGALKFDGTTDYVNTNHTFHSVFKKSFSINLWVRPDEGYPSGNQYMFGCDNFDMVHYSIKKVDLSFDSEGNYNAAYGIGLNSEPLEVIAITVSDLLFNTSEPPWTMISYVVEAETYGSYRTLKIYVNGQPTNQGTGYLDEYYYLSNTNLALGALLSGSTSSGLLKGSLDDVMIFDKALSSDEVWKLYMNAQ